VNVVKLIGADFMPITFRFPVLDDRLDAVVAGFISKLNTIYRWDIIYIGALCGHYPCVDHLVKSIELSTQKRCCVKISSNQVQTYYPVTSSWDEQFSSLQSKQKSYLKKSFKEIEKRGLTLSSKMISYEDFDDAFEGFVEMHQFQWQSQGMPGHFVDWPYSQDFHKEVAKGLALQGNLRLLQIMVNENVISYEYMFKFSHAYQAYLTARSNLDGGTRIDHRVRYSEKVRHAISEGLSFIDSGRGKYDYKIEMGGQLTPVHAVLVYPLSAIQMLKVRLFLKLVWLVDILYSKIWRRRIAIRSGVRPRPFWIWWLKTGMLAQK
jgi:hypothetical protein